MHLLFTVLALGTALSGAQYLGTLTAPLAALVSIPSGIVLAMLVTRSYGLSSVMAGAIAALIINVLGAVMPEVAGAFMVLVIFTPRALRAQNTTMQGVHLLLSLVGGLISSLIVTRFAAAAPSVVAIAAIVSGLISSFVIVIPVDDELTAMLTVVTNSLPEPTHTIALRAVQIRRRSTEALASLDSIAKSRVATAWRAVESIARARVLAKAHTAPILDKRFAAHIDALERLYAAAEEREARMAGFQDSSLVATRLASEDLEAEVRALSELAQPQQNNITVA